MNQLILAPASLLAQRIDSIIYLVVPHDMHLPSGGTFVYHYCRQADSFWKFLIKGVLLFPYCRICIFIIRADSCIPQTVYIYLSLSISQRTFFCRFLSIGEEKMSPLSKKRGHHDLRILRFERTASTAAVRTRGDFGSIPSPLHLAYSPMLRSYPIMNHSVPSTCFLHELQIKTVQHGADGNAEQHP